MVHDPRASFVLLGLMLATAACHGKSTVGSDADATGAGEPPATTQAAKHEVADPAVDPDRPKPAGPLTQEEKDLIAADPKDLTPELRRKRAYALRKKIMQNPDSPAARNLEEIRRAVLSGELHVPGYTPPQQGREGARLEARQRPADAAPGQHEAPTRETKTK